MPLKVRVFGVQSEFLFTDLRRFFKMTSLQQLHLSRSDSHYEIINNILTHFFTSQR